jgi:Gp19/Gp15/Gp42-like protein
VAETNVGDAVALVFQAVAGIAVTAEVILPEGTIGDPVTVTADTGEPTHYPFTFIPDRVGVWRVRFRGSGAAVATETYTVTVSDTAAGPAPYATAATIATVWRDLTAEEDARAETLCRYASAIIRTHVPGLDARLASGALAPDLPMFVCTQMVLRVLRNPSGVAAETVGPWSVTYGSQGTQATGALFLSESELALLTGVPVGARRGHAKAVYSDNRFWPARPYRRAWGAEA